LRPGGHAYYLEVVATGAEASGEWLSAGADLLGLSGNMAADDLAAVLAGADPSSGSRLGRSHDRVEVAGFDLTFCAPKSVSLLHALGARDVADQVRFGHGEAVREALSYVERSALGLRRGTGAGRTVMPAEAVAAGGFLHRTSRALDPHLHSHVVVANLGRAPDGTWSALDGRGIYAHAQAAGGLYHAHLRHELTRRLGVGWDPSRNGRADIAGIGPEVRRVFSRRAAAIEAHLAERGLLAERPGPGPGPGQGRSPSRRARTVAAFATRAPRDPSLAPESLRGWWEERAREAGLSPRLLEATLDKVPRSLGRGGEAKDVSAEKGAQRAAEAVLVELGRSVTRRDAVRAWCSVLGHGAPAKEIEHAAQAYLSKLAPVQGWAGERDGPGVAERSYVVEGRSAERGLLAEQSRMTGLLAARGISRADRRGFGRDVAAGLDLGF
jgi:conjugative relaxase-like TrwC/TraI family protein